MSPLCCAAQGPARHAVTSASQEHFSLSRRSQSAFVSLSESLEFPRQIISQHINGNPKHMSNIVTCQSSRIQPRQGENIRQLVFGSSVSFHQPLNFLPCRTPHDQVTMRKSSTNHLVSSRVLPSVQMCENLKLFSK